MTLARLLAHSPFGIFMLDAEFRMTFVSAGARPVFHGIEPLIGRDFAEIVRIVWPEPFASEAIARFRYTLETGESYHSAHTTERRHNVEAVESYDWRIVRLTLPDERFGVACHFYDATPLRAAEAAYRESETWRRFALDAAELGVWHLDPAAMTLTTDARFREIYGVSTPLLTHEQAIARVHPEDRERVRRALDTALHSFDSAPYALEYRLKLPDGSVRWVYAKGRANLVGAGAERHIVSLDGTLADVSALRTAEIERDRLRADAEAAQARLMAALNGSPAFMGIVRGPDHVYEYVNDAVYELVGRRELIGKPLKEALPELAGQGYVEMLDGVYRTGKPYIGRNVSARLKRSPDGPIEQRYIDFAYQPLLGPDGSIDGIFFHGVDVSDRLEDEKQLRKSEQRYRALALTSSDVAYRMSADWSMLLPLDGRELVASVEIPLTDWQWLHQNIPADDHPAVRSAIQQAIESKTLFELEHRVNRPDGTVGWTHSRAVPILDDAGNILEWFGAASDITEQKRAEAALRESEARFRALAETIPQLAWYANPDGYITWYNPRWYAYTGTTPADMEGWGWQRVHDPAVLPAVMERWKTSLGTGQPFDMVFPLRRFDGVYRSFLTRVEPLRDANGTVVQWFGTNTDITERLELEASLRHAKEAAEAANVAKDNFLATLSHEIRTPLSAILGWSQILRRDSTKPSVLKDGLETIERNARVQSQIIEDLLDMSRIISGKIALKTSQIDLAEAVKAAIDTVRPAATAKAIALNMNGIADAVCPVLGDFSRLQQVFWNLLSNAVKFTPKSGVVDVWLGRRESSWEVNVTDSGEGIDPAFLPFVFDRFRQADASTTRKHGGLGLGLSIVKQLVELHGGRVEVRSEGPGKGSTFTVRLPMSAIHSAQADDAPVRREVLERDSAVRPLMFRDGLHWEAGSGIDGATILVVDDEADARSLLSHLLTRESAKVILCANAQEALQQIQSDRPDILVSDVGMPEEDGLSLIRRIRALPEQEGGKLPAIALTAYARAEDRVNAIRAGFNLHVPKPVEPAELLSMIETLLARR